MRCTIKWFKHDCDMHTDLKIQALIERHGLEGYAVWNICLELLGKEGHGGKLDGQTRWQEGLLKVSGWSNNGEDKEKLTNILSTLVELKLICSKSFKYGNLHIPKFSKRADDYTMRKLRTQYEESTEKVTLDKNRIDKNRIDKIILHYIVEKGWESAVKENPSLNGSIFKRNVKPAKQLILIANDDDKALKAISNMSDQYQEKGLDWTLETVIKHFIKMSKGENDGIPDSLKSFIAKK